MLPLLQDKHPWTISPFDQPNADEGIDNGSDDAIFNSGLRHRSMAPQEENAV